MVEVVTEAGQDESQALNLQNKKFYLKHTLISWDCPFNIYIGQIIFICSSWH